MKILLILNGLGNEGITNIALTYLNELIDSEIKFEIVAAGPCDQKIYTKVTESGVKIYKLPNRKKETCKYVHSLFKLIWKEKYDIVHIHGNSATMAIDLFVSWFAGCKIRISHCHNTKCDNERINNILRPFLNLFSTARFACGIDAGNWLYKSKSFEIIPNGRDIDFYSFDEMNRIQIRKELNIKDDEILVGHVGTFTYQKNQEKLISVFKTLEMFSNYKFKLVLIGDGPLFSEINNKIIDYNLEKKVILTGNITNVEMYLSAFDVMVLPSRYEGLPLVSIEWQANGLPCVFSNAVTKQCKVLNNNIFLSLEENDDIWARTVIEAIHLGRVSDETEIREKMIEHGFSIIENAEHLKRLYEDYYSRRN